jgi:hypothetical protein
MHCAIVCTEVAIDEAAAAATGAATGAAVDSARTGARGKEAKKDAEAERTGIAPTAAADRRDHANPGMGSCIPGRRASDACRWDGVKRPEPHERALPEVSDAGVRARFETEGSVAVAVRPTRLATAAVFLSMQWLREESKQTKIESF